MKLDDTRVKACGKQLKVSRKDILPILAVAVHLERDSCEASYLCPLLKRANYRVETTRNVCYHITTSFPNMIDIITASSLVTNETEWTTIFKRKLHVYNVWNAVRALTSDLRYTNEVKVLNRTCCAYDRPVVPGLRAEDVYINHICDSVLVYVIFFRCVCLYLHFVSLLQLITHRLSRLKRTNYADTVGVCDTYIPIQFSLEATSPTKVQQLYAWNRHGSFTKSTSYKAHSIEDIYEYICKTDTDGSFKGNGEKNFSARLRKNVWLSSSQINGLTTSIWVFPMISPVITIINRLAEGSSVHPKESMRHESLRLCTFRTYPTHGKPSCIKIAKAGFYYASQGDEVICYCCAKRISNWNERDDPLRAHRLVSPSCPFLLRNSEVNEPVTDDNIESSNHRLNRILQSLEDSDERPETLETENVSAPIPDVSSLSTTTRSRTTEHATNLQNGVSGSSGECTSDPFTRELTATTNRTVGESQFLSVPVQQARSSIPAGSFACSSVAEAAIATPNDRRETAVPRKAEGRQLQGASNNRSDETREKLLSENRALKAQSKCLRCRRNDVCIAFLPCGHLVSCEACSTDPSARKCFSCDAAVKARIKAFIV
ncbi:uncharacterized protein LOC127836190 [Dreissena polymorpha]|nr:uncharacterized protein LOC127836190 [Dreissena polymorpha]